MARRDECGCNEYRSVSRRNFMKLTSSVAIASAMPAWVPRVVLAQSDDSDRDVVVSIFLRGGVDSLSLCVPFNESAYYDLRPTIAFKPPDGNGADRVTALDDNFGIPPSMTSLLEAYESGDLLVVHACGLENPTKSHFEAMHYMEVGRGNPPATQATGWLGRHLAATAPSRADAALRAVGIGYGLQRTLVGAPLTTPVEDLDEFGFAGRDSSEQERKRALEDMYASHSDPLKTAALNTLSTVDLLDAIDFAGYRPGGGASYPDSDFGYALRSTAALITADIGVEAVAIDLNGWDTHTSQGPQNGYMAGLMRNLAEGLAAFHADLFSRGRANVAAVAMSEFGRNAFENGSGGTDHGHGGLMLALGGHIAGGRVLTDWPGLDRGQLYVRQDLAITTDYRDVIGEILTKRAGNQDVSSLFPDPEYVPKDLGVIA